MKKLSTTSALTSLASASALTSLALLGLFAGCGGVISDPNTTVATLSLTLDKDSGALVADACVTSLGPEGCAKYPNDNECETMHVDILADGRTVLACHAGGKLVERAEAVVASGSPFVCKASKDLACQVCNDIYGAPVLDTCNRGTQLFRQTGGGWNATPGDDIPGAAAPGQGAGSGSGNGGIPGLVPEPTQPGSGGECDPENAKQNYTDAINKILVAEGLGFAWSSDYVNKINLKTGFWGYQGYGQQNLCNHNFGAKLSSCWNKTPGKCHCIGNTCRCVRINVFALKAACALIPKTCTNKDQHTANLVMSYGAATAWLFSVAGGGNAFGSSGAPPLPPGVVPPKCKGSPLVLDLDDNGIELTSEQGGVHFDLLGLGTQRTAWIKGGDALLVYDRNGNGKIDDGTELFGEATPVGGLPAADGFEALAELDKPDHGGNGNGIVEQGDLLFAELRVWRDRNKDGQSQPEELSTLSEVSVIGIDAKMVSEGHTLDQHGNDLGLRGGFIFKGGKRGLMIDVLFSTSR